MSIVPVFPHTKLARSGAHHCFSFRNVPPAQTGALRSNVAASRRFGGISAAGSMVESPSAPP